MAIFHSLEFDGINSTDNGIFITGEAVYNAPEREVEMISIPGRNGAFALDKGRYENITVTYPAGAFGTDQEEFARKIRSFRNLLASKNGYKRLVDTYHPDEYRMGIFKDAFEVEAVSNSKAGEFNIVFDCKPQRYLMSGEAKLSVNDGDMIYNPTPFESSPLLEVEGYGTIGFNGYEIELDNGYLGYTEIQKTFQFTPPLSKQLTSSLFNSTDDITVSRLAVRWGLNALDFNGFKSIILGDKTTPADTGDGTTSVEAISGVQKSARCVTTFPSSIFSGSEPTTLTDVVDAHFMCDKLNPSDTVYVLIAVTATITVTYTPSTQTLSVTVSGAADPGGSMASRVEFVADTSTCSTIYADSTVVMLGNPTYIDCDFGEAYKYENGEYISLNQHIDLGSNLPKLASGNNEITFDNTITELKIVPRWWIV